MSVSFLKRYRNMVLVGVFCFYLGFSITLTFLRIDCAEAEKYSVKHSTPLIDEYEYAVLVVSAPKYIEKRESIRATWGRFCNNVYMNNGELIYKWNHTLKRESNVVKLLFAIGTEDLSRDLKSKLESENRKHNDLLLLENVKDSYNNLSLKVMQSFKWISFNMGQVLYVIKCDDDSFLRVDLIVKELDMYAPFMDAPHLLEFVSFKVRLLPILPKKMKFYIYSLYQSKPEPYKGLYWGYFNGRAKVYLGGKWQESSWFLCDNYLPYALGGGYVVSRSIVDYIARNLYYLSNYASEDVSMGVWTAAMDGINRVHDVRFDTEWISRGCLNNMLIRHKQSPHDMFALFDTLVLSEGKKMCMFEMERRKPYDYDWNVMPSNCCK